MHLISTIIYSLLYIKGIVFDSVFLPSRDTYLTTLYYKRINYIKKD